MMLADIPGFRIWTCAKPRTDADHSAALVACGAGGFRPCRRRGV